VSKNKLLLLVFCVLLSGPGFGQRDLALTAARKLTESGFYFEAREKYELALKNNPDDKEINTEYADILFFYLDDYEKAYSPLLKSLHNEKDTAVIFLYALAKCEHYMEKYTEAEAHYKRVLEKAGNKKYYEPLVDEVKIFLDNIEYARKNQNKVDEKLKVVNAGKNVNSFYAEYVPVVDEKENFLMFTSRRKNSMNEVVDYEDDRYREDMYMSQRTGDQFSAAQLLPYKFGETQRIQNSRNHESLVSISPDGKTLFLYKKGTLWKSSYENGQWSEPQKLERKIISDVYDNHISITADGKKVFFTSERKKGYGGLDIYMCAKTADGEWSVAVNMGELFNTDGDEQSPFISRDGKTLFFASNGHKGFGGYDIYRSVFDGKKWSEPENMGRPINSCGDDLFFSPNENCTEGFLSSNRQGVFGNFDIFRFYSMDAPSFDKKNEIKGYPDTISLNDLGSVIKKQVGKNDFSRAFFRLNDSVIVKDTSELFKLANTGAFTKVEAEFVYVCDTCIRRRNEYLAFNLEAKKKEQPVASKDALATATDPVVTATSATETFPALRVYFDFDKALVNESDKTKLNELGEWLKKNPAKGLIIKSHTDCRGSEFYNYRLSYQRAQAVLAYLSAAGIPKRQLLRTEAKGETSPLIKCSKDSDCSDEQHAENRRVEFSVSDLK
jgi:outer membrane protein OmpA-like peptidoglycan-associated protein/tetratricopeptide (TPR) repeat protein